MKGKECESSYVSPIVNLEKLHSVKEKLKKKNENYCSLTISLLLTQKKLKLLKKGLIENDVLPERSR